MWLPYERETKDSPGLEPATSGSAVWRLNHSDTEPTCQLIALGSLGRCSVLILVSLCPEVSTLALDFALASFEARGRESSRAGVGMPGGANFFRC